MRHHGREAWNSIPDPFARQWFLHCARAVHKAVCNRADGSRLQRGISARCSFRSAVLASRGGKTDDPFRTFHEWSSEADAKAYGKL